MNFTLTDAQQAVMVPALAREDRCIYPVTADLKGGAVGNIAKSLLRRGLIEEIPASDNHSIWRCDDEGRPLTLCLTEAGRSAIDPGIEHAGDRLQCGAEPHFLPQRAPVDRGAAVPTIIEMLKGPEGATVAEMADATGWQPHSVRGALSGVIGKKLGHLVSSAKVAERGRVYRIEK